jgi:hypothetical protein
MIVEKIARVSLEDFARCHWEEVVASSTENECFHYAEGFRTKLTELSAAGDDACAAVFQLLHDMCFFQFEPSNRDEPFKPLMTSSQGRTVIPSDIGDHDFDALRELAPKVVDPELRGRLSDVLWVRKRDHQFARIAVDAYLESARSLEGQSNLPFAIQRIERALRLGAMLNDGELIEKVKTLIGEFLDRGAEQEPLRCVHLMRLLIEFESGDPLAEAERAKRIAERSEAIRDFDAARRFWGFRADWLRMAKDQTGERDARIAAAETYIREAERFEAANRPNHMLIADRLGRAIEAHRRIGGEQARVDELHKRLLAVQPRTVDQMARISSEQIDVKELVERSVSAVSGKSLYDALVALALLATSRSIEGLRKEVEQQAKASPLVHALGATIVTGPGKTVAWRPPMVSDDPSEREEATRSWMFEQARFYRGLTARACIEPARKQIFLEHPIEPHDWEPIVANNPFIPHGRETIFAKGLHAGLVGNLLVSAHLLIPQLENSFHSILASQNVTTSKLDDEGIQREMHLQELLHLSEFKNVFGEDLTFDLKGLLVEQSSSNLRHRLAHGLLDDDHFFSAEVHYLWWLVLRFCCLPIRQRLAQNQNERSDDPGSSIGS